MILPRLSLVLGGARSGKSAYAERLVEAAGAQRLYLATGSAGDAEMAARIAAHRDRRGQGWQTAEIPVDVSPALEAAQAPVLFDCLTFWLSNVMFEERDQEAEVARLLSALQQAPGPVVIVSNEVGMGLVPETPLGRAFRDAQGAVNAQVAAVCDCVVFVAAGLPLSLKGDLP